MVPKRRKETIICSGQFVLCKFNRIWSYKTYFDHLYQGVWYIPHWPPIRWTEWLTDRCKNITLSQTPLSGGNDWFIRKQVNRYGRLYKSPVNVSYDLINLKKISKTVPDWTLWTFLDLHEHKHLRPSSGVHLKFLTDDRVRFSRMYEFLQYLVQF